MTVSKEFLEVVKKAYLDRKATPHISFRPNQNFCPKCKKIYQAIDWKAEARDNMSDNEKKEFINKYFNGNGLIAPCVQCGTLLFFQNEPNVIKEPFRSDIFFDDILKLEKGWESVAQII